MKIELKKKPKNVTIIEGFPGFGLVGTITTEYLLDHLKAEQIGTIWLSEMNPMVAVHEGKVVDPIGIFYDKKNNLVIVHAISNVAKLEWKIAAAMKDLAKLLSAKEIVSVEGVGSMVKSPKKSSVYYYSKKQSKKFERFGLTPLEEGVVMGVTAALLVKMRNSSLSCVFAETSSGLPDSRAAAKVIDVLDKYLGLKIDTKPLLKKAEVFESKVQNLMQKTTEAKEIKKEKDKKQVDYFG